MTQPIDPSVLDVRIHHRIYDEVGSALEKSVEISESLGGGIIPLLGPTRCGKTEIIADIHARLGRSVCGPGTLLETSSFGLGRIPPKPNDRDLYRAMLLAIGHDCGPKERTATVRERLLRLIHDEGIQTLAIDECSHCAEPGANLSARAAADHFKTIVDATGITLILSGLPKFQKLVDGNEQFRDRTLETLHFPPYAWSSDQDRGDFTGAVYGALNLLRDAGLELAFDELDMARRLYGASGGRVGQVLRILKAALSFASEMRIDLATVAKGAKVCLQGALHPGDFFDPTEMPSDARLIRAYAAVMKDADLDFRPFDIDEFDAVRFPKAG